MEPTLVILRGVSGSGKTTLAELLEDLTGGVALAADDYFYGKDAYKFDRTKLGAAHEWCRMWVENNMEMNTNCIIVHNTNTTEKEVAPYLALADKFDYRVMSLVVENRHGNTSVHEVPETTLLKQASRLLQSIKVV